MILQSFLLPDDLCDKTELFYQSDTGSEICIGRDPVSLILDKGAVFSGDSYMNFFDKTAWRKFTYLTDVELLLRIRGEGVVEFYENDVPVKSVPFHFSSCSDIRFRLDMQRDGNCFFKIRAAEKTVLYQAFFFADDQWQQPAEVKLAVLICTYNREKILKNNLELLWNSRFFDSASLFCGKLFVYVTDNASALRKEDLIGADSENPNLGDHLRLIHSSNLGGSGGFSRCIREMVKNWDRFPATHAVFMDDDSLFLPETFYRLFALLSYLRPEYSSEAIAGRMFRLDKRNVQYTASEVWNRGQLRHMGYQEDMCSKANFSSCNQERGEYAGWWFAAYPYRYVSKNLPLPFFLHCDDVEYGLRHTGSPIVLNGIQVWHDTYEYRLSPQITFYDQRNSLIVNAIYGLLPGKEILLSEWKEQIARLYEAEEYLEAHMRILAMWSFLKGKRYFFKRDTLAEYERLCAVGDKRWIRLKDEILLRLLAAGITYFYEHIERTWHREVGMKKPKISVIVPIYNAEKYLYACLESIRGQTLNEIEVICVDDGSTDDSPLIIRQFVKKDPRFKLIRKSNAGYGNSMNRGLLVAAGEYIGIVESDDYIVKEMYEELYALSEGGTVDVVKGNFWDCYEEADGSVTRVVNPERDSMPDVGEAFSIREHKEILIGHPSIWSGIYRRDFIFKNEIIFKEIKGGGWTDNPFFYETLFCAEKIKWTSKPYYCYQKSNESASSVGYDFSIPFERMLDNLAVAAKHSYYDEDTQRFLYRRALTYLTGAVGETHYAWNEDYARPFMRRLLMQMNPDVVKEHFNAWDQLAYFKYRSPLATLMPQTAKILIYNWISFDNPERIGGEVTTYCRDLIASLLRYRPDVQIYFISSGCAYDVTRPECYFRKLDNIFGERCRCFEIVNSPVPSARDMLFCNPEIAFKSAELKRVMADFIEKNGPFKAIHFNNLEGLSLDVFELKRDLPDTKFIYSMHNYVPFCLKGFYFRNDTGCNCSPEHTAADCDKCIERDLSRRLRLEIVERAKSNIPDANRYHEDRWAITFGFEKLDIVKADGSVYEFARKAKRTINENMDLVLAGSERMQFIAEQNGILPGLLMTKPIGIRIADFQIGHSIAAPGEYFKIAYVGSDPQEEKNGYPFFINALKGMDPKCAASIDLVITSSAHEQDAYLLEALDAFHFVEIIHGNVLTQHEQLQITLRNVELGIIPPLWEDNLPQVAIEMVVLGVPILCSDAGGASELCRNKRFRFKAGDADDFLLKLSWFAAHRDRVKDYWSSHTGLVTMKQHCDELMEVYEIPEAAGTKINLEDYSDLLAENEFLYRHFEAERPSPPADMVPREEVDRIAEQRDYLQYVIDETQKSRSYRLAMVMSALPRRIREIRREEQD